MTEHYLKCNPAELLAIRRGDKTFEFRVNDRDYQVGDTLKLREHEVYRGCEISGGKRLEVRVTYVLRGPEFNIPDGYCIMSVELAGATTPDLDDEAAWCAGTIAGLRFRVAEQRVELWEQTDRMYEHSLRTLSAIHEIAELKMISIKGPPRRPG